MQSINKDEVLALTNHKYFHNDFIILNKLEYYENEYEECRFLFNGYTSYIVLNITSNEEELQFLEENCKKKIPLSDRIIAYEVAVVDSFTRSPLLKYLSKEHPIVVNAGLKINRKNEYLKGFGPQIISTENYTVFANNEKCDYNPESAECGLYKIRVNNYPDITFLIRQNEENTFRVLLTDLGWDFKTSSIQKNYQLEGCYFKAFSSKEENIGRIWIRINLRQEQKYAGTNILLKAIKKSV